MATITLAFVGLFLTMATRASLFATSQPTLVEFWHTGDDALSEKLADHVERAFERSPDFTLSTGRKPGTLIVGIPTNVDWKQIGKRTQVLYRVEFASADNEIRSKTTGSCWDDELDKCVDRILKAAKIAAHKTH